MEGALKDRMVMALTKEHFCLHFLNNDILGGQTCIFLYGSLTSVQYSTLRIFVTSISPFLKSYQVMDGNL